MTAIERKILDSVITLLEKKPLVQITVTEICAFAGVSKRSFYNYFCDKYDVILKVQAIPEEKAVDREVSLRTLENYFRLHYRWLLEHRGFLKNISSYFGQNSSVLAFKDSVVDLLWKIVRRNVPDLKETTELGYALRCFADGYVHFVIDVILNDPAFCETYFSRDRFIDGYIPAMLLPYLTD